MRDDNVTISVIVPVYNVADFLQVCVESILPALREEDEIILSLGQSNDSSTELSKELANKYEEVRIVYQTGTGLSNARNCAISTAKGDYIICVDGDDYVQTEKLWEILEKIRTKEICEDLIVHDYYRFDRRTGQQVPCFQIGDISDQLGLQFMPTFLRKRKCFWNVWRFIYKKSFLLNHSIVYRENKLSEDVDYTTSVFLAEPSIRFTHSPFYIYTVGRGDSLMDQPTLNRLQDTIDILKDSIFRLRESKLGYASKMIAQFQFEYILNLAIPLEVQKCDAAEAWILYDDWNEVLRDSTDFVVVLFTVLFRLIGIRLSGVLLHRAKIIRRWLRKNKYVGGKL